MMQARKSVLIHQKEAWTKKDGKFFDVTMGSDDGAEICELVVLFILSLLSSLTYGEAAQYTDDGLMAVSTPRLNKRTDPSRYLGIVF